MARLYSCNVPAGAGWAAVLTQVQCSSATTGVMSRYVRLVPFLTSTVNTSAGPPGASVSRLGSPVIETVRPLRLDVAERDLDAGTTVAAEVAAGPVVAAVAVVPGLRGAVPPDEQPTTAIASAQNEAKAAAARRYDIEVPPQPEHCFRHRLGLEPVDLAADQEKVQPGPGAAQAHGIVGQAVTKRRQHRSGHAHSRRVGLLPGYHRCHGEKCRDVNAGTVLTQF